MSKVISEAAIARLDAALSAYYNYEAGENSSHKLIAEMSTALAYTLEELSYEKTMQ